MLAVPIEKGATVLWHGYEWEIKKVSDESLSLSSGFQTRPMTREAFYDDYMSGKIQLESAPSPEEDSPFIRAQKRIESLTKKERKQLRYRKHFCDALRLETHPCSPKTRSRVIEEVCKEKKLKKKPSIGAVYYSWKKYFKSGFHPLSLLDANHLKGNRYPRLDPLVVTYVSEFLIKHFLINNAPTKRKFMQLLDDFLEGLKLKCPSYKAVFKILKDNYSEYDICVLQYEVRPVKALNLATSPITY